KVPIIFLSSRTQNMDMIMAINMGGDDFIQKPFDLDILVLKIYALLRRKYTYQEEEGIRFMHKGLKLNVTNSTIDYKGNSTELSRNEFILLQFMMRHIGTIISREDLMQALWNEDQFVDDNTLTVNVNRIRKKIAAL